MKSVLHIAGNSARITFPSLLLPPHAEHRLLIKFRAEASLEERHQILASYGEPELPTRHVGESVLTLKLKENVSSAMLELSRMDRIVEWVEPDYVTGVRGEGTVMSRKWKGMRDEFLPQHSALSSQHSSLPSWRLLILVLVENLNRAVIF